MTSIQILSDLHLESPKAYDIFEVVPHAPYLALLGDIGNIIPHREELVTFLTRQLRQFQAVLFVPGNHEAYGGTWTEALSILEDFEQAVRNIRSGTHGDKLGEFVVLNRGNFEMPTKDGEEEERVVVLGCSLFSHVPPQSSMAVEMGLQDFFQTTSWDTKTHNAAHDKDLDWLNSQVQRYQQMPDARKIRIVILTHWSPTMDPRSLDPRHANSPITPGFATDLSAELCFRSPNVSVWAFGHTHFNCDFAAERDSAGPLRLVTNQKGYYFSQSQGFDEEKIVEV